MATKIVTKNSSTAGSAPLASDLVQGELAVNVTDKRLYTENASGTIVEVGTNPSAEIIANGGIALPDNGKATFGAADDLEIYHDGSNSIIKDSGAGNIQLQTSGQIFIGDNAAAETFAVFNNDGAVGLYYNNAEKLATTSTGIDVTGTASADQLNSNDGKLFLDDNGTHNGVINAPASLYVNFDSDNTSASEKILFGYDRDGTSGGTSVMEINSTGIDVTGTVTADGLSSSGALVLGVAGSTNGFINTGESLYINIDSNNDQADSRLFQVAKNSTDTTGGKILLASENGDISFYENTGTTAKFFWDASAESLGIGTNSLSYTSTNRSNVEIKGASSALLALQAGNENSYLFKNGTTLNIHNQSSGPITFDTAATERMRISSSGNVGIGTTSPYNGSKLDVTGSIISTSQSILAYAANNAGFDFAAATKVGRFFSTSSDATGGHMTFITGAGGGNERMRIDAIGNVGIGTSSPVTLIEASGSSTSTTTGISSPLGLSLRNTNTTDGNYTTIQNRDGNGDQNAEIKFINVSHAGNTGAIAFTTRSATGEFAEKVRISHTGSLGIGTASPSGKVHIQTPAGTAPKYYIGQDATSAWSVGSPASTNALHFRDEQFSAIRMAIDGSGNVLVGKTAAGSIATVPGCELLNSGLARMSRNNAPSGQFNRNGNEGEIVTFSKAGATIGTIGTQSGADFYITGSSTIATGLRFQANEIVPVNGSAGNEDAAIDLGKSNIRFKDLHLSGGVYLGGTGAANKLDDYEEGTWTPAFTNIGTGTYGVQLGRYTKVGNLVTATFHLDIGTLGSAAGALVVSGLPFISVNVTNNFGTCTTTYADAWDAGYMNLGGLLGQNQTALSIKYQNASGTMTSPTHANMQLGNLIATIIYEAL